MFPITPSPGDEVPIGETARRFTCELPQTICHWDASKAQSLYVLATLPHSPPEVPQFYQELSVKGGGKLGQMGDSIVGLRLSTVSESVLTNWPAEMSYSPYGECDFESKRTGKTSGPEQFAR